MYYGAIPQGPTPAPDKTAAPDRTQILDPKDYWPKVSDCPDWPYVGPNQRYDGQMGKAGAEARLEGIGRHLNRAAPSLRVPTADDRTAEFARTFKRSGTHSRWYPIGVSPLSPLGMMSEGEAEMIVEACHIRGYLAKLEAKNVRDAEAAQEGKRSEARRALEEYRTTIPGYVEEITGLAEAVARHNQRIEDEKAVGRSRMLRDHAATLHSVAVSAAHTLGLGVPDAPQILE